MPKRVLFLVFLFLVKIHFISAQIINPIVEDTMINDGMGVNNFTEYSPIIHKFENGEYIAVWSETRQRSQSSDIYFQRFDELGNPVGTNTLINENIGIYSHYTPIVASDSSGTFIVVWVFGHTVNMGEYSLAQVYGQKYSSNYTKEGEYFRVTSIDSLRRIYAPKIAMEQNGNFTIAWQMTVDNAFRVYARIFDSNCVSYGDEFSVNDDPSSYQRIPSLATNSTHTTLISWQEYNYNTREYKIYAQSIIDGKLSEKNIKINDNQGISYRNPPSVATDGLNRFIILWDENSQIYGQILDQDINIVGSNFRLNEDAFSSEQFLPVLANNQNGNTVVVWRDGRNYSTEKQIYARLFDTNLDPVGNSFMVNDDLQGSYHFTPFVSMDKNGEFAVSWMDKRTDTYKIYIQSYDAYGNPMGKNINPSDSPASQINPAIATQENGDLMIVWQDYRNEDSDIFGRMVTVDGKLLGSNFIINEKLDIAEETLPQVTVHHNSYFVGWQKQTQNNYELYGQFYDLQGQAIGENFKLNDNSSTIQNKSLKMVSGFNHSVSVLWEARTSSYSNIYVQHFDSTFNKSKDAILIKDSLNIYSIKNPSFCIDKGSNIILTWAEKRNNSDLWDIYFQTFSYLGDSLGGKQLISPDNGFNNYPSIVASDDGGFVIAWYFADSQKSTIKAKSYFVGKTRIVSDDFAVPDSTHPSISLNKAGETIVSWNDMREKTTTVYAQILNSKSQLVGENFRITSFANSTQKNITTIHQDRYIYNCWVDDRSARTGEDIWLNIIEFKDTTTIINSNPQIKTYPNPFKSAINVEFKVYKATHVAADIFNILGQKVVRIFDGFKNKGDHFVNWDAKNNLGNKVNSGLYVIQLKLNKKKYYSKILFLK